MSPHQGDLIVRHSNATRVAHWAVAITFTFLFLSGLALFSPFFFWLSALFGGGPLMRFIHPLAGVVLAAVFYPYALSHLRDNRFTPADSQWLAHMGAYLRKDHADIGETGKYNAGQKLMYWSMLPIIAVLAVTGVMLWQPWFAPAFGAGARRVAGLVHAACAFVMFVGIGIHVYAAVWTKGSIDAMVRGTVSRAWARFHHPGWYREVGGKGGR
ncbi:MAG TPA: formate dehydrogenase subunit gamma [Anaeromyxobacteraceae bacterium]